MLTSLENSISWDCSPMQDAATRSLFIYFNTPSIPEGLLWKQLRKIEGGNTGQWLSTWAHVLKWINHSVSDWALEHFTWWSREIGRGRLSSSWSWVVVQELGWTELGWAGFESTCHFCLWIKEPGERLPVTQFGVGRPWFRDCIQSCIIV